MPTIRLSPQRAAEIFRRRFPGTARPMALHPCDYDQIADLAPENPGRAFHGCRTSYGGGLRVGRTGA